MSRILRFVDHTISAAPDTDITMEAQCLAFGCGEESGGHTDAEPVDMWALRHTGRTGHALFRRVVTSFAVVTRH